uniref:Uncharacterized protein n=1 Tax=Trichogramma kaykai TaxID=54128 RepID=A0ABD2X2M8_9HYME
MIGLNILFRDWQGQLPNLRDVFQTKEIERLLMHSIKDVLKGKRHCQGKSFIDLVLQSDYKDEPDVDGDGKPLLCHVTTMHRVAKQNYDGRIVRKLFDKVYNRFDVNYTDETGFTHLHAACKYGFEDIVKKFLEQGQDPECLYKKTGVSPLHVALFGGHKKVVELLLRSGANPNLANKDGSTPLHVICNRKRNHDLVNTLFEFSNDKYKPININAQDNKDNAPLHLALLHRHKNLIEVLLRRGSDPNLANAKKLTALHIL